jgi:hypothetical protein
VCVCVCVCAHVKLLTDLISTQQRDSLGEWSTSPISPAINKYATNKQTRLSWDEIELSVCRTAAVLAPYPVFTLLLYVLLVLTCLSLSGAVAHKAKRLLLFTIAEKWFTYCQKHSTNALHTPYLPLLRVPFPSTLRNVLLGHFSSPSLSLSLPPSLYLSICAHGCKCCEGGEGAVNSKEQSNWTQCLHDQVKHT